MITQALGEIDYEESDTYPKKGSRDYYDGTVEYCEKLDVAYWVFSLLLVGLTGAFLGSILTLSTTIGAVKEHYCTHYDSTIEYKACLNKPIQEIYTLMEKH